MENPRTAEAEVHNKPVFDFSQSQRAHAVGSGPAGSSSQLRNSLDYANITATHGIDSSLDDDTDLRALRHGASSPPAPSLQPPSPLSVLSCSRTCCLHACASRPQWHPALPVLHFSPYCPSPLLFCTPVTGENLQGGAYRRRKRGGLGWERGGSGSGAAVSSSKPDEMTTKMLVAASDKLWQSVLRGSVPWVVAHPFEFLATG